MKSTWRIKNHEATWVHEILATNFYKAKLAEESTLSFEGSSYSN